MIKGCILRLGGVILAIGQGVGCRVCRCVGFFLFLVSYHLFFWAFVYFHYDRCYSFYWLTIIFRYFASHFSTIS